MLYITFNKCRAIYPGYEITQFLIHLIQRIKKFNWGGVKEAIYIRALNSSLNRDGGSIAVAAIEADEAIASSDFLKIMGISPQKEPTGVILVSFDHFASSDFNVWLRPWEDTIYHQYGATSSRGKWRQTGRGGWRHLLSPSRTTSPTTSLRRLNWGSWQMLAKAFMSWTFLSWVLSV